MAVKPGTPAGSLVEVRGNQYLLREDATQGNSQGASRGGLSVLGINSFDGSPMVTVVGRSAARLVADPGSAAATAFAATVRAAIDADLATGGERAAAYWASNSASLPPAAARTASSPTQSGTGAS